MRWPSFLKKKPVVISLCGLACWFVVHVGVMLAVGLSPEDGDGDVIVVLGNTVAPTGVPSQRLRDRLEKAFTLFMAGRAKHIIVSGGLGSEGHNEAKVMRNYLVTRGVPDAAISVDNHGINTRATATFTAQYLSGQQTKRVIVVSQYYHILRCKLAFRQAGIPSVLGVPTDVRLELRDPYSIVREFVAYYAYLARGSI